MLFLIMNKRMIFFLTVLALYPLSVFGLDISVSPESPVQGDAFMISIQSDEDTLPSGKVGKKDILFHRISSGNFIAISSTGIEQPPDIYTVTIKQGTVSRNLEVKVGPRKSRTINLTLPPGKVTLTPQNEKRAEHERNVLKTKWSKHSERMWQGRFFAPLGTPVSTEFGIMRLINGHKKSIHKGVDYKGKDGTPIRAINAGIVSLTDDQFFGGKTVMVDHGEGIFSIYMHLSSITVEEGQRISRSDTVGLVGSSGRSTGPHLHLTVKWDGLTVDPVSLFNLPIE